MSTPIDETGNNDAMAKSPNNADWRGGLNDPAKNRKQNWQQTGQPDATTTRRQRSRKVKTVAALTAFFGTLAAIVIMILWLYEPPRAKVIAYYARYENTLAVPHGEHFYGTALRIQDVWNKVSQPKYFFSPKSSTADIVSLGNIDFTADIPAEVDAPALIVYVGAHGGVDDVGPYFLSTADQVLAPAGGQAPSLYGRIRVGSLLSALNRPELAKKAKLVALDCVQMTECAPLGMVFNDFVRQVGELVESQKIPGLAVMCSCGPLQRSWVSDELGATFFGEQFAEALTGMRADLIDRDRKVITIRSFHQSLKESVAQTVTLNRMAYQAPVIFYSGKEAASIGPMDLLRRGDGEFPKSVVAGLTDDGASKLEQAWKEFDRFRQQLPPPFAHRPDAWRLYVDSLLRAESLLRLGTNNATNLADRRLSDAHGIAAEFAPTPPLKSAFSSLGMLHGLYPSLAREDKLPASKAIDDMWSNEGNQPGGGSAGVGVDAHRLSQVALDRLLSPDNEGAFADLLPKRFRQVVEKIDERNVGVRRPIEVHLPYMLGIDLPPGLRPDHAVRLSTAVKLRRAAERVAAGLPMKNESGEYGYPERVLQGIRPAVEAGDAARRMGEDLLFTVDPKHGPECDRKFKEAQAHYAEAEAIAAALRRGFTARDRAGWELPYLTRWLAECRVVPGSGGDNASQPQNEATADDVIAVRNAWKAYHGLRESLDKLATYEPFGKQSSAKVIGEVERRQTAEAADLIEQSLNRLRDKVAKFADVTTTDPTKLVKAEPVLALPTVPPAARLSLLKKLHTEYKGMLGNRTTQVNHDEAVKPENLFYASRAERYADLTQVGVGKSVIDSGMYATEIDRTRRIEFDVLTQRAPKANRLNNSETSAGRIEAKEFGSQMAIHSQAIHVRARQEFKTARAKAAERDLALRHAVMADRAVRAMDGSAAALLRSDDPNPVRPAEALFALQRAHYFYWQAGRAWADHWFDVQDSPNGVYKVRRPYFDAVAGALLNDARAMANIWMGEPKQKAYFDGDFAALEASLKAKGELAVSTESAKDVVHFTTQRAVHVDYKLSPGLGWVGGTPVGTLSVDDRERLKPIGDSFLSTPLPMPGPTAASSSRETFGSPFLDRSEKVQPNDTKSSNAAVAIEAIFRGQRPSARVDFRLHPLAHSIVGKDRIPDDQSMSLYASEELQLRYGLSNGTVVFVLDASNSMKEFADGRKATDLNLVPVGERRFAKVKEALLTILRNLPIGTNVSIWVYGHEKSVQTGGAFPRKHGSEPQPEDQIERLTPGVIRWEGTNGVQFAGIREKLEKLVPEGWTPMARAMYEAAADFQKPTGIRTMIVLTDGMDTAFGFHEVGKDQAPVHNGNLKGDPKFNPDNETTTLPKFIEKTFVDKRQEKLEVIPYVLGIQLPPNEENDPGFVGFKQAITSKTVKGRYVPITDVNKVVDELNKILLQKMQYKLSRNGAVVAEFAATLLPGEVGRPISIKEQEPDWLAGLQPDDKYAIAVAANRVAIDDRPIPLTLAKGDRLLLEVYEEKSGAGDLKVRRDLLSNRVHNKLASYEGGDWRASVLARFRAPNERDRALLAVEQLWSAGEGSPGLRRPTAVWIEGGAPGATDPRFGFRWRANHDWPAPCWYSDWQPGGDAKLKVWWSNDKMTFDSKVEFLLRLNSEYRTLDDLLGVDGAIERNFGESKFWIEEIAVRDHFVREDKDKEPVPKKCLVIRIRHERNAPVWIREIGHPFQGCEQRFFSEANSTTALFWPAPADQVKQIPVEFLKLISVARFKKQCESAGMHREFALPKEEVKPPESFLFGSASSRARAGARN